MSISYPLTLPSTKSPARISFTSSSAVAVSRSPWTYNSQVQAFSGQVWLADISLPAMERADAEQWISFLLKLNGQEGTFLLGDGAAKTPRGTAAGSPLVNGASQTGQSLITDGWTSGSAVLKAGDYIQIGQRLYKVLNDVTSDGSGNATLDIWPRLRESPANNDPIVTASCVGLFRLASNQTPLFSVDAAKLYGLGFNAVEAL